jgi:hypothetical protein
VSNRDGARKLAPGHYALGNLLLDTPEVMAVKKRFGAPAAVEPLSGARNGENRRANLARGALPCYGRSDGPCSSPSAL